MTVQVEFTAPKITVIRVSGEMLRAEVDAGKHQVHDFMQVHGRCLVMIRLAVVGDLRWRDSALLFLFNSLVPFQIEYFPAMQEEFAIAWLTH